MNRGLIVLTNLTGMFLFLMFSLFKAAAFRRQVQYWMNTKYLNFRSYIHTIR
ncbi:hypothetical protein [Rossellomorea aquimaris]|uniref:hypothetical protein n=1 Tax=Rossellomorea aquimaris TaxID=189382 RepID=UPI0014962222|nr:hypothetical protein [Rossellomorea aquimaris]